MTRPDTQYLGVRLEGGLFQGSLLERIAAGDRELKGSRPEDYHLAATERIGDAASRKWLYLRGVYKAFRDRLSQLPETNPGTSETREHWLLILLAELGFGRVPYLRGGIEVAGKAYPVSHLWEHVPMHLIGWGARLDIRGTQQGRAPQAMLQELLNTGDDRLYGLLSNGRQLRLLRSSKALAGFSYVEFDLETIFDGELYSDFLLLFALLHQSRFELLARDDEAAPTHGDCWLERWRIEADETGIRARDRLRDGVRQAMHELGTGFLEANQHLRNDLESGRLALQDYRHELLRVVYQFLFLFTAEERGALHDDAATPDARDSYQRYFSGARLRRIARLRRGDRNADLWRTQVVVLDALGSDGGLPGLGLPGLGGLFFRPDDPDADGRLGPDLLRDADLTNGRLLAAIRALDETTDDKGRPQRVDYQHIGAEEFGSVYESLLDYEPQYDPAEPKFGLENVLASLRKTTGTYFTPPALIETILDSALQPLIEEAARPGVPADLLTLTVCDPTCGSGYFLVAAAKRIATKIAAMTSLGDGPTPREVTAAMHDVVARCVFGVDISPLAVEITKISLWLESLTPGKPLAFLDHHVKVGNSLLGVTPKLLYDTSNPGDVVIPDAAFKPIEGDDTKVAASLRKQNEQERYLWDGLFEATVTSRIGSFRLAEQARRLAVRPIRGLGSIREQAREYQKFEKSPELRHHKQVADAWCAAFVWRKHADAPPAITTEQLRRLNAGEALPRDVEEELDQLAQRYQFFHWHLEFPEVFRVNDRGAPDHNDDLDWWGGFSCVLGNPPWERVKLQEEEFFSARRKDIAQARNAAARKKAIRQLVDSDQRADQQLLADFRAELRLAAGISHLLRETGRYPLTGRGDINTYAVFAETARTIVGSSGRTGQVLPTGIGTDATTAQFFSDLVQRSALVSFLEFENEAFILSKAVHHSFRFCLLSTCGRAKKVDQAVFAFGVRYIADLADRTFPMTPDDLKLVNPNTKTTPLFRYARDADITRYIYERVPVLWRDETGENPWGISFMTMFHMASDSRLFRTEEELLGDGWKLDGNIFVKGDRRMLPLFEAKMIHHFDHRYGTYQGQTQAQANVGTLPRPTSAEKADPGYATMPRYWVQEFSTKNEAKSRPGKEIFDAGVAARLKSRAWYRGWLLGWRDIARSSDERTMIVGVLPRAGIGHTFPLMLLSSQVSALYANLSSFVFDYVTRQKIAGTHLTYGYVNQFPVLPPERYDASTPWEPNVSLADWVAARVLELTYTAWDMEDFARDLGDDQPPFVWDGDRRQAIRAELDAAYFHLYEIDRDDVDYIMEAFPTVRKRDEAQYDGDYRIKTLVLKAYDAMAVAIQTGVPYRWILDPAPVPGQGRRHAFRDEGSR